MRVEFTDIDATCQEIADECANIYRRIVRVRPYKLAEQKEEISFIVGLWVTAVVKKEDGDWIIEFGQECGIDRIDGPEDEQLLGTEIQTEWKQKVQAVCEKYDLELRSGKWEIF